MARFENGDLVVVTGLGLNSLIGKVGEVTFVNRFVAHTGTPSVSVRFLQPTDRGERIMMLSTDELAKLTETKLDKLPYDIVP